MSLRPRPIPPVPEETARVARAAFPKGNIYIMLRDELGLLIRDEDFASLFSRRGQPAEAPLKWPVQSPPRPRSRFCRNGPYNLFLHGLQVRRLAVVPLAPDLGFVDRIYSQSSVPCQIYFSHPAANANPFLRRRASARCIKALTARAGKT